mmetsp:Transcript_104422/g.302085  ORF Transcript_104422/g.302085 Transcript_104422/m.302085 type:complete len:231 (-) Transcript_104422:51-743(-)
MSTPSDPCWRGKVIVCSVPSGKRKPRLRPLSCSEGAMPRGAGGVGKGTDSLRRGDAIWDCGLLRGPRLSGCGVDAAVCCGVAAICCGVAAICCGVAAICSGVARSCRGATCAMAIPGDGGGESGLQCDMEPSGVIVCDCGLACAEGTICGCGGPRRGEDACDAGKVSRCCAGVARVPAGAGDLRSPLALICAGEGAGDFDRDATLAAGPGDRALVTGAGRAGEGAGDSAG